MPTALVSLLDQNLLQFLMKLKSLLKCKLLALFFGINMG